MGKRLRRGRSICSCKSPRPSYHAIVLVVVLKRFEKDLWTEIAKFLDGKSLMKLAVTSRWFHSVIMHDSIWRFVCLRDLQVPEPGHVAFNWNKLYASVVDGSHSYTFREKEKHLDWMRIGAFHIESTAALLSERLDLPLEIRQQNATEKMFESCGASLLNNIKTGIWIADLQLVRCPVCELDKCDGIFDLKLWTGEPTDFQPKAMITFHAVAINTNLQVNDGLLTKYYMMRAGPDGEVVSIRISQQLL
uniref:F-box domain-containing protein n=1 Tax=Manihot esculenta TaxID=3983 RepID=A0A2C9WRD4_MANES